jgi:hypothetical protein
MEGERRLMANQWALLIGINQYKALQPLMYAQADAIALRDFFVDELGVPVNHCTLLTDLSAAIEPHAYAPLRQEIEHQLEILCRDQVQPGDTLWVFFSGCGLAENGQDYWMTLDSEPMHLAETAIPITRIFDRLSKARTDQILLVMDMNRSQGAIGHRDIGAQSLTLAQDFGIPTLLSCQPDEFAHETLQLRHGLFTKAVLEGLRYHGCVTVSQLAAYVSDRVPELCEHYYRPPQKPAMVIPADKKFLMIAPSAGIVDLDPAPGSPLPSGPPNGSAANGPAMPPVGQSPVPPPPPPQRPTPPRVPATPIAPPTGASGAEEDATVAAAIATDTLPPGQPLAVSPPPSEELPHQSEGAIVHRPTEDDGDAEDDDNPLSNFWKWGALAAALAFLVGVFLRYQPELFGNTERADRPDTPAQEGDTVAPATAVPNTVDPEAGGESANGEPLFPEPVDPIEAGQTALQRAEEAIAANRYGEAQAWLNEVPPELQDNRYQSLLQEASGEVAEAAVRNQGILQSARQIIQPTSASKFNDAIEQARRIPPEDPLYEQAQADMARWSRIILDLAEGRAASGEIALAIAAARLVPDDQPEVYSLAQQRITAWEQQIANQELIRQTQNSLQPGQASSFNDAIRTLEQITPDQPGYTTARERSDAWSEDILAIARARAAQGNLPGAIAAARLVPPNTAAYEQAQLEIERWQNQE